MSFALLLLGIWLQATWALLFPWPVKGQCNHLNFYSLGVKARSALLAQFPYLVPISCHIKLDRIQPLYQLYQKSTQDIWNSLSHVFFNAFLLFFLLPPLFLIPTLQNCPHPSIHSLSIHYAGKTTVTKRGKSLPSWNLHSSGGYRRQLTNR